MATQGKPLSRELKQTMVVWKDYFDRTKDDPGELRASRVQRVANAWAVGSATVKRGMADDQRRPAVLEREDAPWRGRPPWARADSLQTITRDYVRRANQAGKHITLARRTEHLEEPDPEQRCSVRTRGRTRDRWGFTVGKGTRSQQRKEKDHVVAARQR